MAVKFDLTWNKPVNAITNRILDNQVKLFAANEAKKLMEPYTPMDSGAMAKNARVVVDSGNGVVIYPGPYARFLYYGKVMVGVRTKSAYAEKYESKVTINKRLKYKKLRHPLATSDWDKAMLRSRKNDLTRAIQNYIGGK